MSTHQQVLGNWNQLKGKVKEKWGQITDDELKQVGGNYDQLVGLIQQRTGQAKQEIERMVNKLSEESNNLVGQAAAATRQYVEHAGDKMRDVTHHLRERSVEGYEGAQEMIRRRPTESIVTAFGTGLFVGLTIGMLTAMCMQSDHR